MFFPLLLGRGEPRDPGLAMFSPQEFALKKLQRALFFFRVFLVAVGVVPSVVLSERGRGLPAALRAVLPLSPQIR